MSLEATDNHITIHQDYWQQEIVFPITMDVFSTLVDNPSNVSAIFSNSPNSLIPKVHSKTYPHSNLFKSQITSSKIAHYLHFLSTEIIYSTTSASPSSKSPMSLLPPQHIRTFLLHSFLSLDSMVPNFSYIPVKDLVSFVPLISSLPSGKTTSSG